MQITITRPQMRAILRKAQLMATVARELGVSKTTVTQVLRGKCTSARVYAACEAKALEILAVEKAAM